MTKPKHPNQPIVLDTEGVPRFKANPIVKTFLEMAQAGRTYNMNHAYMDYERGLFTREDMVQFAQLIGYSVSGFGELGYVKDKDHDHAHQKAEKLLKSKKQ